MLIGKPTLARRGFDTPIFVDGVYKNWGTLLRGLAHPFIMDEGLMFGLSRDGNENPLEKFGAVSVGNPRNFYSLLESGDAILLYPGGITEAFHSKVCFEAETT